MIIVNFKYHDTMILLPSVRLVKQCVIHQEGVCKGYVIIELKMGNYCTSLVPLRQ